MYSVQSYEEKAYEDKINAFNRWCDINTPSRSCIVLYFRLLNAFNNAQWPDTIELSPAELMGLSMTSSKKTAYAARDELIKAGFIEYIPGNRGRGATIRLLNPAFPPWRGKHSPDH